jgi:hypothetical protein
VDRPDKVVAQKRKQIITGLRMLTSNYRRYSAWDIA